VVAKGRWCCGELPRLGRLRRKIPRAERAHLGVGIIGCDYGVDALIAKGWVDRTRGFDGWSQGGTFPAFITARATASSGFRSAQDFDWMTYYANTDITPFRRNICIRHVGRSGNLQKTSPSATIAKANTPNLIQHERTTEVPIPNAYELRSAGRPRCA